MNEGWTLRALRWTYAAFIAMASLRTALETRSGNPHHASHAIVVVALAEAIAAIAFLVEALEVPACGVLLMTYALATVFSIALGDYAAVLRFLYYAMTALTVVAVHRALRRVT